MASVGLGNCPLEENKELCAQVIYIGEALPEIIRSSKDTREALIRIEAKVEPLPEMAKDQKTVAERVVAVEEHQRGLDIRILAIEKTQEQSRNFVITSLFMALMAFITAAITAIFKRV